MPASFKTLILALLISFSLLGLSKVANADEIIVCESSFPKEGEYYKIERSFFKRDDLLRKIDGKWESLCNEEKGYVNYCEFLDDAVKRVSVYPADAIFPDTKKYETLYDFELFFVTTDTYKFDVEKDDWTITSYNELERCTRHDSKNSPAG